MPRLRRALPPNLGALLVTLAILLAGGDLLLGRSPAAPAPHAPVPGSEAPTARPEPATEEELAARKEISARIAAVREASEARRPAALRRLIEIGPDALPAVRRAREAADSPALRAAYGRAATWILADRVSEVLQLGLETMLTFDGQYSELSRHGAEGIDTLLALVDDSSTILPLRVAASRALADVGDSSLLPRIRRLHADPLMPHVLREQLGILMAIFGDTHVISRELAEYRKHSAHEHPAVRVPALIQLSNLHYRIRDYAKAVEAYEEILAVFDRQVERVKTLGGSPEAVAALREEQTLHYYNAACSNALLGDYEKAKKYLREAVRRDPTHFENVEKDGDLRRLRAQPGWKEFSAELGRIFEGQSL